MNDDEKWMQIAINESNAAKSEDEIPPEILRYQNTHHIIHSTVPEDETHSGIIGLLCKDYDVIDVKELIQGRVLNIKTQHTKDKTDYNISAVYLDTNNHITRAKVEKVVAKLRLENQDHPQHDSWRFQFHRPRKR